eukprot:Transcript_2175.p2 GENE.Transcript_2175~~Transcript_2175.p2  ORF type:complete len:405 (-),score=204.73 Transcript_2175:122-1336(-)
MRKQNLKTTSLVLLVSLVSTSLITLVNVLVQTDHVAPGPLTTVWVTAVIILSNVIIFAMVPHLAIHSEFHHYRSTQQTHMLVKMAFFQVFNTTIATLIFLVISWYAPTPSSCPAAANATLLPPPPPPPPPPQCFGALPLGSDELWAWGVHPDCVQHWYTTGAFVLINALFGDLTAILFIIELVRPDKLITRYVLAPRAATQVEMNALYAQDAAFYLPFRYQLTLKIVCLTLAFCPAIPLLLPYATIFMVVSYRIDRYNLLRVMRPPPRTTDRTISMSVLYILPLAVFAHVFSAIFFYSKRVGIDVPTVYYAVLAVLALFIMVRISAELRAQANRPIKDAPEAREMTEGEGGEAEDDSDLLRTHLDSLELYVPPLTSTLLNSMYVQSAERVTVRTSTRRTRVGLT